MTSGYSIRDVSVDLAPRGMLAGWLKNAPDHAINILKGITLTVNPGEIVGLVGESGSGKTTLARAMVGLQPISHGQLGFRGKTLSGRQDFSFFRRNSALMFQDSVGSLSPRLKIEALLVEPFMIHGLPLPDQKAKAAELLERVGLSPAIADRYPHELSGGQARRVCVARALALNPSLVIADEPTAGLDVSVQAEILNLMTRLKRELNIGFLIISHNLSIVRHVSDRVAILYLGRLVEEGPTREVFANPAHPYTRSLIASQPQPDPRKRRKNLAITGEIPSVLARPSGCAFNARCLIAAERCHSDEPQQRFAATGRSVRCHFAELPGIKNGGNP